MSRSRSQWPEHVTRHFAISICIHTPKLEFLLQIIWELCTGQEAGLTDGQTDGGMDKAITICLPQLLWGHKTVLLKKLSSWLPQTQCVYTVHHSIKPESPSDGRCFIVILTSKWMSRCSLKFNPQSVIRYQQFALWVKMSSSRSNQWHSVFTDIMVRKDKWSTKADLYLPVAKKALYGCKPRSITNTFIGALIL